jgi:preprotein translocase subunit SecY
MNRWLYIFKIKDLRNRILYVLFLLFVFRVFATIPVPGVDVESVRNFFASNQFFSLANVFSGGGLSSFSIVMLGVGPYITSSIIMQMLTMVAPSLKALSRDEGEKGREQFNQYVRYLSIPIAIVQSVGMISLLRSTGLLLEMTSLQVVTAISVITAGATFLMWLGEIITDKKVGNGLSLIIAAGILASIPQTISQIQVNYSSNDLPQYLLYAFFTVLTVLGVVVVIEGQRNIPIKYSRSARGLNGISSVQSYLPLKVNQAGVMPIIFALSLMILPGALGSVMVRAQQNWLISFGQALESFQTNQIAYAFTYFILVLIFTYFYTYIVFEPKQIAENLQRQGGFIPGFRPGSQTEKYVKQISNRIILGGAVFLGLIAVLPFVMTAITGNQSLAIGGTGLLIVVQVIIETNKQIESQIIVKDYDSM